MDSMVPFSFLLVDGNNIIHAWPELHDLHRRQKGLARTELQRQLLEYQDQSGKRVVLVFDGRGPGITDEREPNGLQVIYTNGSSSADDVIERLAAKYAEKYDLTVATDDLLVQNGVISSGGFAISSNQLSDWLDRAAGEMQRFIERRRKR